MEAVGRQGRIWEIDVLRGICIPGMIAIHLIYDLVNLYGIVDWPYPYWYSLFKNNYGALFVLVSGLSVTLGRHCIKRGAEVFAWGMVITAVTAGMYGLGMADRGILIYFGVLHCIGLCMMAWSLLRRLPDGALIALSAAMVLCGWWLRTQTFGTAAFVVLGLMPRGFYTADYFPLMPKMGYFRAGAVLGRTLYRDKKSLFPGLENRCAVQRFFGAMGRHSLLIYLIHQPLLAAACQVWIWIGKLG